MTLNDFAQNNSTPTKQKGLRMTKLTYFARSALKLSKSEQYHCPNCGCKGSKLVERKYFITALRRCDECKLMFRTPTDSPQESAAFYNDLYEQGFTTGMPTDQELSTYKASNFKESDRDYEIYLSVLAMLGCSPGQKLFDFGCSWGYGSYQLSLAGYDVTATEISLTRRKFAAEKLGVRVNSDFEGWSRRPENLSSFDVFFSSHVLEHVPSPSNVIDAAFRILKPGGLFVAFHPNGSEPCRATHPTWSRLWGEVHPNMIDDIYYDNVLGKYSRIYGSTPSTITSEQRDFLFKSSRPGVLRTNNLEGSEMFVAARKNGH
ncbi:class I SAM-dependent methyltransferase [Methylocystis echinoides]|uniref:class I SAM-dependent methyltransferase n=1 Tax=Methylocystis echinoides TaxID=29468 RepID=UPI00341E8CE8